ncbi:MAG TPA: UDP-glucose/GDP-mannose dehydrogenase family protein [Candidatus Limnocylindrales bacterium]
MEIAIVGAGYVGLVTAACLASLGTTVRVVEMSPERVAALNAGASPIAERGLDDLLAAGLAAGRLSFSSDPATVHGCRLVIVAVGTLDPAGEWTDRLVREVVLGIARDPAAPRSIVIRSTLLPGTAVSLAAEASAIDPAVEVGFNPEFTRESSAVDDFLHPDRIVIGVASPGSSALETDLRRIYEPLEAPVVVADRTSAEMIKMASNVYLATKITFANELARLCEAIGADAAAVVDGVGFDKRIGRAFLSPGPGFGGSCLPSQARALPALAAEHGLAGGLFAAVDPSNAAQADWLIALAEQARGRSLEGARVALLGLTFKAGTGDLRESPALRIARGLLVRGALVRAFDPLASQAGVAELARSGDQAEAAESALEAVRDAEVVVIATEWPEFRGLDWTAVRSRMAGDLIVDARHIVDAAAAATVGLRVVGVGHPRPAAQPNPARPAGRGVA